MARHVPEELLSGIPEIDGQHRDLFDMYNKFSDVVDEAGRKRWDVLTGMGVVTAEDMAEAFALRRGLLKMHHGGCSPD